MSENVDLSPTIIARSDQLNADDLLGGPQTFVVRRVRAGDDEQPIWVDIDGWPTPWKPCKTMRRVMVECWGKNGADYVGNSLTLFRNPEVKFGGIKVGGIEISHLSHLDRPHEIALAVSRGKKKLYVIHPLKAKPTQQPPVQPSATNPMQASFDAMKAAWKETRTQRQETVTPDDFRTFVSESTSGRVGMADALIVSKYTAADIDECSEAVVAIRESL